MMMLCLHLFNRDYKGLFVPLVFIGNQPLSYYISLFCDSCVPVFAFVSGYGLYFKYQKSKENYFKDNVTRLKKLYINYWIIIAIFPVALGFFLGKPGYPGSYIKLLFNMSGLHNTYSGAWWFLTVYVLFVLTSRFWFSLLSRINIIIYLSLLLIIYIITFYLRINKMDIFQHNNAFLDWLYKTSIMFFCTLFQFMLGAFALFGKWNQKIGNLFSNFRYKQITAVIFILMLIVIHGLIPNFIIAPFLALTFIFLFCQLKLSSFLEKIFDFLVPHSTNMWLIHMFFYMTFFSAFIYGFLYPVVIFFVLIAICIICSFVINYINSRIQKI